MVVQGGGNRGCAHADMWLPGGSSTKKEGSHLVFAGCGRPQAPKPAGGLQQVEVGMVGMACTGVVAV